MTSTQFDLKDSNFSKSNDCETSANPVSAEVVAAIQAGLAATAKKYSDNDDESTPKNPERGTLPYDNNKSVFYHN